MAEKQTKFIFVTGGVVSGLGKGITAASLGRLLKCRGLKVASQKLDPYVNVDPGTMSPLQHGEVFVTDDGTETDLDLGHYERFIDENLNKYSNLTTGKVYWNVLNKERQGAYLGQTVQIIPHITNEIKSYIYNLASSTEADVVITEIGGTTGDIESQPFLEAIRQVGLEQGRDNCCYIHVVLVPYISGSDEYKSKPAQHSVKELQGMGVNPDIIILRADGSVGGDIRRKISTFCNVKPECVIENLTMPSLYQCPLMLHTNGLDDVVVEKLKLDVPPADLTEWKGVVSRIATRSKTCTIALVGKYVKLHDAYLSVMESLYHAGFENESKVEIHWVDSENLLDQERCAEELSGVDGIILPGGFGDRGIEGMIQAARYAREQNIPYFGICLGMQIMVMEYARDVLGYADANSSEFTPDGEHNVIALIGNNAETRTVRNKACLRTADHVQRYIARKCIAKGKINFADAACKINITKINIAFNLLHQFAAEIDRSGYRGICIDNNLAVVGAGAAIQRNVGKLDCDRAARSAIQLEVTGRRQGLGLLVVVNTIQCFFFNDLHITNHVGRSLGGHKVAGVNLNHGFAVCRGDGVVRALIRGRHNCIVAVLRYAHNLERNRNAAEIGHKALTGRKADRAVRNRNDVIFINADHRAVRDDNDIFRKSPAAGIVGINALVCNSRLAFFLHCCQFSSIRSLLRQDFAIHKCEPPLLNGDL